MKAKRFMIEFANYQIDSVWNNELMQDDVKYKMINKITSAIRAYENGLCTVHETMDIICNPGKGLFG